MASLGATWKSTAPGPATPADAIAARLPVEPLIVPDRTLSPWPPCDGTRLLGPFIGAVADLLVADASSLLAGSSVEDGQYLKHLASIAEGWEQRALSALRDVVARPNASLVERQPPMIVRVQVPASTVARLIEPDILDGHLQLLRDVGAELRAGWQLLGGEALEGLLAPGVPAADFSVAVAAVKRLRMLLSAKQPAVLVVALPLTDAAALQAGQLVAWRRQRGNVEEEEKLHRQKVALLRLRQSTEKQCEFMKQHRGLNVNAVAMEKEEPLSAAGLERRLRLQHYRDAERLVLFCRRQNEAAVRSQWSNHRLPSGAVSDYCFEETVADEDKLQDEQDEHLQYRGSACLACRSTGVCWSHSQPISTGPRKSYGVKR
eukprot:TRINITY_DN38837_c0_g1_i1.p1 TRINITY_DN38837_c0_g1~~TRINITY_DN38837_c0_g1_i1.p1  ORF type:complete len:375 (-),score=64.56 TRINITY_DN38837_c0_g1_i1:478-1602(-)